MGLIRGNRPRSAFQRFLLAGCCAAALAVPLSAQSRLFSAEIQNIEKKLANSAYKGAERQKTLAELARLLELSGNLEGAARAWEEAGDIQSLLRSAACYLAIGEFEKARSGAQAAALRADFRIQARYLEGQIDAHQGNPALLRSFLPDPDFAPFKPGIYYNLWKLSGDAGSKNRLMAEFPASPEAQIAKDDGAVIAAPSPLWLLGSVPVIVSPSPAAGTAVSGAAAGSAPPPAPSIPTPSAGLTAAQGGPSILQTGLFSREENARVLAARLTGAGFTPLIVPRTVNGSSFWAVGVAPGQDYNKTILLLKDAGFEAFPVFP